MAGGAGNTTRERKAASNLAWVFATCPEDSIRDGARAAELGERAIHISGGKIPMIFRVLAAAFREWTFF